jgi:hypothetical protein
MWQNCTRIIADLLKNGNTKLYFGEPVSGDYYPEYYEIIKEPRDLGTIKKNLDSRTHYKNIYELRDDVRLCFENCRMFNPQGHQVRNFGDAASNAFEKKWAAKNVEAEWEGELQRHKLAMDRLQAGAKSLPEKIKEVDVTTFVSTTGPWTQPQIIKKSTGGAEEEGRADQGRQGLGGPVQGRAEEAPGGGSEAAGGGRGRGEEKAGTRGRAEEAPEPRAGHDE